MGWAPGWAAFGKVDIMRRQAWRSRGSSQWVKSDMGTDHQPNGCTSGRWHEEHGADYAGLNESITPRSGSRQEWQIPSKSWNIHGQDTSPDYKTTGGSSEQWVSRETKVRWRDDLDHHLGPAWPRVTRETDAGGSNPGRGFLLREKL